jgi:hypothetical protein
MKNIIGSKLSFHLLIIFFYSSLISVEINAQIERCGVAKLSSEQVQTIEDQLHQRLLLKGTIFNSQLTIPVAVHIIRYNDGSGDVSDQTIANQISVINSGYSTTNFRFVLHSINRVNNSAWTTLMSYSADDSSMKYSLAVDPLHVLNFYLCDSMRRNQDGWISYPLGYSSLPLDFPEDSYMHGIVIKSSTLPGGTELNYNGGKTAIHEIGHYLGLYHTFELECKSPGDSVADTPYHADPTYGLIIYSCDSPRNTCTNLPGDDPIHNYMNYLYDGCMNEMTAGQSTRMNEVVSVSKPSLLDDVSITIEQRKEDNLLMTGTTIARWENGNAFNNYSVPVSFPVLFGSDETLRGDQSIISNPDEKYNQWKIKSVGVDPDIKNHHKFTIEYDTVTYISQFKKTYSNIIVKNALESSSTSGDSIFFKDPWFIDSVDASHGNNLLNRGVSAVWRNRPSPFIPNTTTLFENNQTYKGVFFDQGWPIWAPPYYSVKAEQVKNINLGGALGTRTFYFQNWSGTEVQFADATALQTGVVFKDNLPGVDPFVNANYKGHFLSNSSTALANNGQRKVVRDKNGFYHMVYESMNYIWYSKSLTTNYQGEWTPDVKLIDYGPGIILANPSIAINASNDIYTAERLSIVFEIKESVDLAEIFVVNKDIVTGAVDTLGFENIDVTYFGQAKPVVASFKDEIFVVYKESSSSFLKYFRFFLDGSTWTKLDPLDLPTTSVSAINPSVAANTNPIKSKNPLQIAWQQAPSSIKYQYSENQLSNNPDSQRTFVTKDVSFGSGNTYNSNPSIIDLDGYGARIAWYGIRKLSQTEYQYRTTYREISASGTLSVFSNFGSNVGLPSINKIDDNTAFILGWSENNGNNSYFTDNSLSSITPLNILGKDLQLCNGSSKSTMFATSFKADSLPYFFSQSNNIQSLYLSKTNGSGINKGREGVVAKGSGEIYFTIGDVAVNGENISFKTLPDSFTVNLVTDVNDNVRTTPFAISDNSQFFYSVQYGITDSAEVVNSLSVNDVVSFRVELVDEATNVVLGVFDNVSFTKQQAVPYENLSYQVSTEGIGNRTVYLRLVTMATEGFSFSLANLLDNQNIIAKKNVKEISYKSAAVIKDYALAQNYPNPFNPVTTITYQLPKSGSVTLKIFDILGNEVMTLVNEQKEMGRYTVQFSAEGGASSLASGMYVYQLRVNDYTSTKKMMLLK